MDDKDEIVNAALLFLGTLLDSIQLCLPNDQWEHASKPERQLAFDNFFLKEDEHKTTKLLQIKVLQIQEDREQGECITQFKEV
jgi:hypothetical protein